MPVLTFPLDCWAGLVEVDTDNEITHLSYVREPMTLALCTDGVTIANLSAVQWPIAREDWGIVDIVLIWDAPTGGSELGSVITTEPVAVPQYAIARIPPAGLQMLQAPAPRAYGTGGFGTGRFGTGTTLYGVGGGVPTAYGVGPYGVGPYGTTGAGANLEITFDTSVHVCEPGTWAPGPFRYAA